MAFILAFSLLFTALFFFYHLYYKRLKLPPGPMPLPFVGNILQIWWLFPSVELAFLRWRREYGPVFTYWMGPDPVVCVADYQKMVDTFVKDGDAYAGRFKMPFEQIMAELKGRDIDGIIGSSGDKWREHRRFALHILRDFGLGKNLMQERILDELSSLFSKINVKLAQNNDEAEEEINLLKLLDVAVGSIINNVMFGTRLDGDREPEFWRIKRMLNEHLSSFSDVRLWLWINNPKLFGRIPPFSGAGQRLMQRMNAFFAYFETQIGEKARELEQHGDHWHTPPVDFVDAFLKEMKRREEAGEPRENFNLGECANVCADLWIAGQETTTTTLAWGIAYLLHNPKCMQKMQDELDTVVGTTDRMVTVADKSSLPYTNAVIMEIQRTANLLPLNITHALTRDVQLDGYKLTKGTPVIPQISAVLIDENYFPNPNLFDPDRFLDDQGKLKRCDELVPFSVGKRQCLGESLARMELFLFIANLFNQYTICPGQTLPSLKRKKGFVAMCTPYTCLMEKRRVATE